MNKLIQPAVSILAVVGLTGAVPVQAEVNENADYTGSPVFESTTALLQVADQINAEFSSVEVIEAEPRCKLIEDHYDHTGTAVVSCRSDSPPQKAEWSYLY